MKLKIGIFDSGIGGFTILNSLLKTRKDVEVIYLADSKRIPFGNKNYKEIRVIAKEICSFFEDKNLDAILIVSPGSPDRGVKQGRFYVIKNTRMPAVLVEIGFLTGRLDARRLEKITHRRRLAYAISKGILEYLDKVG